MGVESQTRKGQKRRLLCCINIPYVDMGAGASVPNEGQEFQSPKVGGATWKLLVKKYKKEDIVHRKKGKETLRDHQTKYAFASEV